MTAVFCGPLLREVDEGLRTLNTMSSQLILYALMLSSLMPSTISEYSSDEDFSNYSSASPPIPSISLRGFVNCQHVQNQLLMDSSLFDLGIVLGKCFHHGVTVNEIESGFKSIGKRQDVGSYDYVDLYLPCEDVFSKNTTKLTTRLMKDYLDCRDAGALQIEAMGYVERRFAEIIEAFTIGNQSVTIDESTLMPCRNDSKRIALLCRDYGITEDQWKRGFLRYHYPEKWVVEENLLDLSVPCDEIFKRRMEDEVFVNPTETFIKCSNTIGLPKDIRDAFEKKNAEKLMEVRGTDSLDLRNYVSCRYLQPIKLRNGLVSVSWYAYEKCKDIGVTYTELQSGIEMRINEDSASKNKDLNELYVNCETVFNDELYSFSSGLAKDYESCKASGLIDSKTREVIQKKFEKMFKIFGMKKRLFKGGDITSHLVNCASFPNKMVELCRRRGSSLAQELRGIGSLARLLGDRWLNTEPLEHLYVRCDDLFDDYTKYMKEVPIEQYIQCRFVDTISEEAKKFIDKRISKIYVNKHKWNGSRYRGDSDIEISSVILFD